MRVRKELGKLEPSLNRQYSGVHEKSVNVVNGRGIVETSGQPGHPQEASIYRTVDMRGRSTREMQV